MSHLSMVKIKELRKGFTLIELLIVIAILGILTTAVLVAINPIEQFDRGRDAGRKNLVNQLGHAVQAYYTTQGQYPTANATWMTTLQTTQDIKTIPDNTGPNNPAVNCTGGGIQQNICYKLDSVNNEAIVYAVQSSQSEKLKAGGATICPSTSRAYVIWSSTAGRTGLLCSSSEPTVAVTGLVF